MKIENRIKIGLIHFELCLFLFFGKNVNFGQFWGKHKFWKFANFRVEIEPNVDFFSLIFKKTFLPMIFCEKIIIFTLFLLTNGQFCSKIQNFQEISGNCQ